MAKVLKNFEFKSTGKSSTYDWDTLLDGQIRQLAQGDDYECSNETFSMMARERAKRRMKAVRISKNETGVVLQAYRATPEQEKAWAAQAKVKAAKKAEANGATK